MTTLLAMPLAAAAVTVLLKMTLVLVLALALTRSLRRASAGARHLVWLVALGALVALPPVSAWSPLPVPVLPSAEPALTHATPAASIIPRVEAPVATSVLDNSSRSRGALAARPVAPRPSLGSLLLWTWAAVAGALLLRLMFGALAVRRIVRRAEPLQQDAWQVPLYEIADRLGLEDAPRLVRSADVAMPFAAGVVRATIVLPAESDGWNAERRSAVLIHELAHVKRRDLLGHTLGRLACAIYWFHPLVWTAARRLRAESERACDDLALELGARPSDYAEHLLDIVACVRDHRTPAVALAMAHRSEFEGRMLAILDPGLERRAPSRLASLSLVGAVAALALLVGAAAPVPRAASPDAAVVPEPAPDEPAPAPQEPETKVATKQKATAQHTETRTELRTEKREAKRESSVDQALERVREVERAQLPTLTADSANERATVLAKLLRTDPSGEVRRVAAWGLERYASLPVATDALIAALGADKVAEVREMAAWALASARRSTTAGTALAKAVRSDVDSSVRETATWAMGESRSCGDVEALVGALGNSAAEVRANAAWAIGSCRPNTAPAALVKALGDADSDVRESAAWALYNIRDAGTLDALDAAFRREQDEDVREGLLRAMGALGDRALPALQRLVTSPDSNVRRFAVTSLAGGDVHEPWPWPRPEPRPYP